MTVPRNEYPRPQLVRKEWLCLNGEWQFEVDNAKSGMERGFYANNYTLNGKINVPFLSRKPPFRYRKQRFYRFRVV